MPSTSAARGSGVADILDEELWGQHLAAKQEMIALVRERLAAQLLRDGRAAGRRQRGRNRP